MKTSLIALSIAWLAGAAAAEERFACNLKAMNAVERARYGELSRTLFSSVAEQVELPAGFAFRFEPAALMTAAEWVSLESRCCPFFDFELEQTPKQGPLWLRLTGREGVKAFIRMELRR